MGAKQQFKGKDVDEAITMACDKLGVSREDLTIEILSTGSSGIFGLCRKQAIIRAAKKSIRNRTSPGAGHANPWQVQPSRRNRPPPHPNPLPKP